MKKNWYALGLFISVAAYAGELPPFPFAAGENSAEKFEVHYYYDKDPVWIYRFTYAIPTEISSHFPDKLYWSIWNAKTKKTLTAWKELEKGFASQGEFAVRDSSAREILLQQPELELIYAYKEASGYVPKFSIPLGEYCQKDKGTRFKNQTAPLKLCTQITPQDLASRGRTSK